MKPNLSLAALLMGSTLSIAGPVFAQTTPVEAKTPPAATRTVRVLPPDVSRSLAIARIPTSRPVPLLIGTYWSCHVDSGHELCRLVLVVCTDDQSLCTEIP